VYTLMQYRRRNVTFLGNCKITHFTVTYSPYCFHHVFVVPRLSNTHTLSCGCRRLEKANLSNMTSYLCWKERIVAQNSPPQKCITYADTAGSAECWQQ
jgi:hypothetical protein